MIKKFENFSKSDLDPYGEENWSSDIKDNSAVVLNLKESDGEILGFHPVYAVVSTDYIPGRPLLIQGIRKENRTPEQKIFLKLAEYLSDNIKGIKFNSSIVDFIENKGQEIRKKNWGKITEITIFFRSKDEIDDFLLDILF